MRFTDSLDRKLEDIKRPPNLPIGHYVWQVSKHPEIVSREGPNGDFEIVKFPLVCVEPSEDVDPDDLEEYGNVAGAMVSKDFLFPVGEDVAADFARAEFNLRRFLGHLGVEESLSLGEALAASVNKQCLGKLEHRPDKNDPEVVYQEVKRTSEV